MPVCDKNIDSYTPTTGDQACNPGRCLDPGPFTSQASTQPAGPHQPGPESFSLVILETRMVLPRRSSLWQSEFEKLRAHPPNHFFISCLSLV